MPNRNSNPNAVSGRHPHTDSRGNADAGSFPDSIYGANAESYATGIKHSHTDTSGKWLSHTHTFLWGQYATHALEYSVAHPEPSTYGTPPDVAAE